MKQLLGKFFTGVAILLMATSIYAQDVIVTNNAQKIEAKILEVSNSEIKYKEKNNPNGPVFVLGTDEISSIIYENGNVAVYDHHESAKESETIVKEPNTLKYVSRSGNTYYCDGRTMRGDSYANFLSSNCTIAYEQYKNGQNLAIAGWILFGVGVGLDVGFSWWLPYSWIPALGCEIACIPTLAVGYSRMHKSADTFNFNCANKRPQTYWSINASKNGLGIAYNF